MSVAKKGAAENFHVRVWVNGGTKLYANARKRADFNCKTFKVMSF